MGWVKEMVGKDKGVECLDGEISKGTTWVAQMLELLHLGVDCTNEDPMKRPSMQEVVQCLEHVAMKN